VVQTITNHFFWSKPRPCDQCPGQTGAKGEQLESAKLVLYSDSHAVKDCHVSAPQAAAGNQPIFAIGTGRCGTQFLAKVMDGEAGVASSHERNPLNETFHRYCQWYNLPVDEEGFLQAKALEIASDLEKNALSFEASAHLSLSVLSLFRRFDAKFILLVRRPDLVVNSYVSKGWFTAPLIQADPYLATGYQQGEHFHHFLGRIAPRGGEFVRWNRLTQVGKLGWYWSALNREVLTQLEQIPDTNSMVLKLEDLDFDAYLRLTQFAGFATSLTRERFEQIRQDRPNKNKLGPPATTKAWSELEAKEFEQNVADLAEQLGYEYRVGLLSGEFTDHKEKTMNKPSFWRRGISRLRS
jgi:hypothetical protein